MEGSSISCGSGRLQERVEHFFPAATLLLALKVSCFGLTDSADLFSPLEQHLESALDMQWTTQSQVFRSFE